MSSQYDVLKERLAKSSEINITVTGRKSGRAISIPIWFVLDGELYLLPVQRSDTQWCMNVLKNPSLQIEASGAKAEFQAVPITDEARISEVVEKFREKYGAKDVKKYYSKLNVAVLAQTK